MLLPNFLPKSFLINLTGEHFVVLAAYSPFFHEWILKLGALVGQSWDKKLRGFAGSSWKKGVREGDQEEDFGAKRMEPWG